MDWSSEPAKAYSRKIPLDEKSKNLMKMCTTIIIIPTGCHDLYKNLATATVVDSTSSQRMLWWQSIITVEHTPTSSTTKLSFKLYSPRADWVKPSPPLGILWDLFFLVAEHVRKIIWGGCQKKSVAMTELLPLKGHRVGKFAVRGYTCLNRHNSLKY